VIGCKSIELVYKWIDKNVTNIPTREAAALVASDMIDKAIEFAFVEKEKEFLEYARK